VYQYRRADGSMHNFCWLISVLWFVESGPRLGSWGPQVLATNGTLIGSAVFAHQHTDHATCDNCSNRRHLMHCMQALWSKKLVKQKLKVSKWMNCLVDKVVRSEIVWDRGLCIVFVLSDPGHGNDQARRIISSWSPHHFHPLVWGRQFAYLHGQRRSH